LHDHAPNPPSGGNRWCAVGTIKQKSFGAWKDRWLSGLARDNAVGSRTSQGADAHAARVQAYRIP
jgi:hypothetical protein